MGSENYFLKNQNLWFLDNILAIVLFSTFCLLETKSGGVLFFTGALANFAKYANSFIKNCHMSTNIGLEVHIAAFY